jgi:uncharacterized protein (DUF1330 family)
MSTGCSQHVPAMNEARENEQTAGGQGEVAVCTFVTILARFGGTLLVADDHARAVEGTWPSDRIELGIRGW